MKKLSFLVALSMLTISIFAQEPNGYYDGTDGLEGTALKLELRDIIDNHNALSYSALWDAYYDTDRQDNGKVWDMYSNCNFTFYSDQCGTYQDICDCYNREHSVPKSWFGEASPMVTDIFHVVPTDGKVNGMRSAYPFGECSGTTYGTGKLGSCTYPGYSGTVFEPADEYKGDFARIYFYMATRYNVNSWSGASFSGDDLSNWTANMMLEWHEQDPVSQKEIDRNNVIYDDYQHNRNPYVDHPEWAVCVFGDDCPPPANIEETTISINVFPNPANEYITIECSIDTEFSIKLYDVTGKEIMSKYYNSNIETFDISEFETGIYLIRFSNDATIIQKLLLIK